MARRTTTRPASQRSAALTRMRVRGHQLLHRRRGQPAGQRPPAALQLAGASALVVVSPRTTLTDLEVMLNRAEAANVTILGFILNEFRGRRRWRRRAHRPGVRGHRPTRFEENTLAELGVGTRALSPDER
ncbi:hypothetical protein [Blastococcus sp. PRF04-17]|uniref:hypothetical protein n=1 Tax=Blastococcus sp. PRF04-17 TaxID=2933797 RepID=UPI001FF17222|nr:hypothetical protein [Blastococcus sp. PRF04-17]UOY00217.1 hypothetical protein MVA48_14525 [Blastococcus sp. PRF04-17]